MNIEACCKAENDKNKTSDAEAYCVSNNNKGKDFIVINNEKEVLLSENIEDKTAEMML